MPKPKHDYLALFETYRVVKESTGMTIKAFCEQENLPYGSVKAAFRNIRKNPPKPKPTKGKKTGKRSHHDWEAYRIEFLQGDFKSVSEFLRSKGIKPKTGIASKKTKGWIKEKAEIEAKKRQEINDQILEKEKRKRSGELQGRVLAGLYECMTGYETAQAFAKDYRTIREQIAVKNAFAKESEKEKPLFFDPKTLKDFVGALNQMQQGLKGIIPMVTDLEEAEQSKGLIQKLIAGEIDITEAALRYAEMGGNLPEAIKILLGKVQPEEPEPEEGEIPSDEELEELYQQGIRRIRTEEIDFVPRRRKEVEALKKETKDSDSFSGIEDEG